MAFFGPRIDDPDDCSWEELQQSMREKEKREREEKEKKTKKRWERLKNNNYNVESDFQLGGGVFYEKLKNEKFMVSWKFKGRKPGYFVTDSYPVALLMFYNKCEVMNGKPYNMPKRHRGIIKDLKGI